MAISVTANRTFFSTIVKIDNSNVRKQIQYWDQLPDNPNTDLQRSYLSAIKSLEYVAHEGLTYDEGELVIDNKIIRKHLSGSNPEAFELVELRSKLVGLMTMMGIKHV